MYNLTINHYYCNVQNTVLMYMLTKFLNKACEINVQLKVETQELKKINKPTYLLLYLHS